MNWLEGIYLLFFRRRKSWVGWSEDMSYRHWICVWMVNRLVHFLLNYFLFIWLVKGFFFWYISGSVIEIMNNRLIKFLWNSCGLILIFCHIILYQKRTRADCSAELLLFLLRCSTHDFINSVLSPIIWRLSKHELISHKDLQVWQTCNSIIISSLL